MKLFKPKLFRVRPTLRGRPVTDWRNISWTSSAVWKKASFGVDGYELEFRPRYAPPIPFKRTEALPEHTIRNGTFTMTVPERGWLLLLGQDDE